MMRREQFCEQQHHAKQPFDSHPHNSNANNCHPPPHHHHHPQQAHLYSSFGATTQVQAHAQLQAHAHYDPQQLQSPQLQQLQQQNPQPTRNQNPQPNPKSIFPTRLVNVEALMQASLPLRSRRRKSLALNYSPSPIDVCCGRGKANWNHSGNASFRKLIQSNVQRYVDAPTKIDKTTVVVSIVDDLRSKGVYFLKQDDANRWYDIGDAQARDKVGHSLRDQVTALARARQQGTTKKSPSNNKSNSHSNSNNTHSSSSSKHQRQNPKKAPSPSSSSIEDATMATATAIAASAQIQPQPSLANQTTTAIGSSFQPPLAQIQIPVHSATSSTGGNNITSPSLDFDPLDLEPEPLQSINLADLDYKQQQALLYPPSPDPLPMDYHNHNHNMSINHHPNRHRMERRPSEEEGAFRRTSLPTSDIFHMFGRRPSGIASTFSEQEGAVRRASVLLDEDIMQLSHRKYDTENNISKRASVALYEEMLGVHRDRSSGYSVEREIISGNGGSSMPKRASLALFEEMLGVNRDRSSIRTQDLEMLFGIEPEHIKPNNINNTHANNNNNNNNIHSSLSQPPRREGNFLHPSSIQSMHFSQQELLRTLGGDDLSLSSRGSQ